MTRALVLFAHPCEESYSSALHRIVVETLGQRGWTVDDCDLYAEGFSPVLTGEEIIELQRIVREVPVTDHVIRYALSLVRQTRVGHPGTPDFVDDMVNWGAGPRAVQFLILGAKARALFLDYGSALWRLKPGVTSILNLSVFLRTTAC